MAEKVGLGSNAGRHARRRGTGRSLFPIIRIFAAAIAAVMLAVPAVPGRAQTSFTFVPGVTVVTGFSGTKLATDRIEAGVDPIDRTFIDPDGPALRIFDVSTLGAPPAGQLINPPVPLDVPARQIGQVFGLAFDGGVDGAPPNLYAAATSAFGLSIVGAGRATDGSPVRLKSGAPDASFMEGQFGALSKSSPSAIYKVDGATGSLSYVADTAFSGASNSGPGIGGLAYDATSKSLYASDLDSGVVHRFGLDYNYADLSQYDHGVAGRHAAGLAEVRDDGRHAVVTDPAFKADDPATWGFTQPQRRVDALAVHDGRLYYAVAEGPEIWSVGLRGGDFLDDARREVTIKAEKPFPVTGIAFDGSGRMIVAQRGLVKSPYDYGSFADTGAQVLMYAPESPDDPSTPDLWKSDPASYAVGTADDSNAGSGGVSLQYGYKPDGTIDLNACEGTVAKTGDTLTATASGVQLNSVELVRPANVPPTQSAFIDYDAQQEDPDVRGHVGGVAAVRLCGAEAGFPPVEAGAPPVEGAPGGEFPPVEESGGGGETFPPVDEGGGGETAEVDGVSITKSAVPGNCTEKGGCTFNIDITNNSGKDLPELTVGDELTAGAANLGGAKIEGAPPAPWMCTAPPKFTCKHPGPIANGETVSLPLSFAPTGIRQEKELQNCATLQPQAVADKAQQQLPPPPPPTNTINGGLKVETLGTSPSCSPATGNCEFEIKITNTTAQPITGPLKIFDTLSVGTQSQAKNSATSMQLPPGLQCKPEGREFNCSQDPLTLNPNQSLSLKVAFSVDTTEGGQTNFVQNKTNVTFGPLTGEATAAIAFDDDNKLPEPDAQNAGGAQAVGPVCASIPLDENAGEGGQGGGEDQGGGGKASSGKTEAGPITIEKTPAVESCDAATPCSFDIKVSNKSGKEIPGPITIADTLPAGAQASAPPAPWQCLAAAGPTISCTHPGPIPPNGSLQPDLSVAFPPPVGAKTVENCATLAETPKAPAPVLPKPTIDEKDGTKFELKALTKPCLPGASCEFEMKVTNTSAETREASFLWHTDFGFVQGAKKVSARSVTVESVTATPAAGCVAVANNPLRQMSCNLDGLKLAANESYTAKVKVKIDAPPNAPTGGIEATAFTDFNTVKGQTIGKTSDSTPLAAEAPDGLPGGVAAPPKPACATIPVPTPVQQPKLTIKKTGPAECSDLGGCTFTIQVTNDGDAIFKGPLDINEEVTADGKIVPGTLAVPAGSWKCTQEGSPFTCGLPDIEIGPQGRATMRVSVLLRTLTGAKTMENCANVVGQAAKACVTVPLIQGPNITLKKEAIDGVCDPACTYRITVTNNGNARFTGPLRLIDFVANITGTQGPLTAADISPDIDQVRLIGPGDVDCKKTDVRILCETSTPLDPGKDLTFDLSVRTKATDFAAENCIARHDVPAEDPRLAKTCVPILGLRHGGPNLIIDKEAPNADVPGGKGHCGLKGQCTFAITVKNIGDAPFTGPLTITDTVELGIPGRIVKGLGSANCTEAQNAKGLAFPTKSITCEIGPFPEGIRPNDSVRIEVMVFAGDVWNGKNTLRNCAELSSAADMGPAETPKKNCADVKLDPFDVEVTKTGDQSCQPGGECRFELEIFNPNDTVPHDDPVTVTDKLSGLSSAQIVSITPAAGADAFPCKPAPTQIPFTCTGHMELSPKERNHYTMIVRLPADASAAAFSNCATVGEARSSDNASDPSCHSVKLAPPEKLFSLKINKTGPATCAPGADCHFTINLFNPGPIDHDAPVTISDKLTGLSSAQILSIKPPLPCATQPTQIPFSCTSPGAVCLELDGKPGDKCGPRTFEMVVRLPNDASTASFSNCASVGGEHLTIDDPVACHPVKLGDPAAPVEKPECKGGMIALDEGGCACPPGTSWNGRACAEPPRAVPARKIPPVVQPPPVCPRSQPVGTFPNCCPVDTHFDPTVNRPRGGCVPDTRKVGPGTGGANGTNQKTETARPPRERPPPKPPVCEGDRPVGTYPKCCPRNMHFERGACQPDSINTGKSDGSTQGTKPGDDGRRKCPPGTIGRYPRCRCPLGMTGSPPNCCPPGTRSQNGKCVRPQQQDKCTGGRIGTPPNCTCPPGTHWTRSRECVANAGPTPQQQPTPSKTEPEKKQCTGGRIGRPPRCRCPANTRFMGGRCRPVGGSGTTTPTPTPPPKCPSGTPFGSPPNCCDADHWNSKTQRCEKSSVR